MALNAMATDHEKTSSFFKKHEMMAFDWENCIQKRGGEIDGTYNAYYVNFKGSIPQNYGKLEIEGIRKLVSVTTNIIPRDSVYYLATTFQVKISSPIEKSFSIKPKGLLGQLFGKYSIIPEAKKFMAKADDEFLIIKLLQPSFTQKLFEWSLQYLRFDPKTQILSLKVHKFIDDPNEQNEVIKYISEVVRLISR